MRSTIISSAALAAFLSLTNLVQATTGQLGDAAITEKNPTSPVYIATLAGNVTGTVTFTGNTNGTGVWVDVDFKSLPATGGPFLYHVHVQPVDASGNCTTALGHLDPYMRGEAPPCDHTQPETCQVGDMSGKHGKVPEGSYSFKTKYLDLYASTIVGSAAYVGNRSVVVHLNSTVRIACANVTAAAVTLPTRGNSTSPASNSTSSSNSTTISPPLTPPTSTNGAMVVQATGYLIILGSLVAGILVL